MTEGPVCDGTVPWPEDLAREYEKAGWWRGRDLGAEIADVAAARPDATALVDGATRISYASLLARADALAGRLARLGLRPGMRIVVQLPNCWPFVVLTLASLPASHNFPLACPGILGTLLSGGRVVMTPSPDPAGAFAAIEREGVTITAVVPAVAQRWLAHATEQGSTEHGSGALRSLEVL